MKLGSWIASITERWLKSWKTKALLPFDRRSEEERSKTFWFFSALFSGGLSAITLLSLFIGLVGLTSFLALSTVLNPDSPMYIRDDTGTQAQPADNQKLLESLTDLLKPKPPLPSPSPIPSPVLPMPSPSPSAPPVPSPSPIPSPSPSPVPSPSPSPMPSPPPSPVPSPSPMPTQLPPPLPPPPTPVPVLSPQTPVLSNYGQTRHTVLYYGLPPCMQADFSLSSTIPTDGILTGEWFVNTVNSNVGGSPVQSALWFIQQVIGPDTPGGRGFELQVNPASMPLGPDAATTYYFYFAATNTLSDGRSTTAKSNVFQLIIDTRPTITSYEPNDPSDLGGPNDKELTVSSTGSYEFAVEFGLPAGGTLNRVEWSYEPDDPMKPSDISPISSANETKAPNYLRAVLEIYANDPLLPYGLEDYLEGKFKVEIEYELEGQTVVMSCGGFHIITL